MRNKIILPRQPEWLLALLALLVLSGCGLLRADFEETFDNPSAWAIRNIDYVTTEVVDERLHMTIDFPDSMFWTTAGRRNLADGRFAVTVEPLAGSVEAAYGLVLRASPGGEDFYFFLISADGYYSVGSCREGCTNVDALTALGDALWTPSPLITTGLNQTHTLAVDAVGDTLIFYINDQEVARRTDDAFTQGDIGIMLQTFDSAAAVAFDDLRFTPTDQE